MDKIYNLTIDTKRKSYNKVLGIKQNENNVVLNITLVQNSIALDLTDCTVRLNYLNNNNVLLQMADIVEVKEGKIKVNLLTKVLKDIGETPVDISIFDKDNRKITSSTFIIVVQASIYTNDVLTKEDMDLVQTIHVNEEERQLKEETRQKDELERITSENNRENKEKERQEAELKRDTAEKERSNGETKRITAEDQRIEAETSRIETEVKRVATENKRVIAETERDTIEKERIAAEKDRVEKEDQRKDNEKSRISQEITRIEQENSRKIQEKDRVNKEKQRVASEIERLDNETIRQKNEQERIANEDIRKDNEGKREVRETDRVTSMKKIIEDWTKLKEELQNLEGGGDMTKLIYDTNRNGIVDDSEKLGGKTPDEFLQKNAGTTWDDINKYKEVIAGSRTDVLKLNKPGTSSKVQIVAFNKNTDILEEAIVRLGISELKDGGTNIDNLNTPGIYLLQNMENPPDMPPMGQRNYIVRVYAATNKLDLYYHVESLGTGKQYMYRFDGGYSEIPCTSTKQPEKIFIDSVGGSDDNDGSEQHPLATWKCAYSRIPKILIKPITIKIVNIDMTTNMVFSGITSQVPVEYATRIIIDGQSRNIKNLMFLGCNLGGAHYGINIFDLEAKSIMIEDSSPSNILRCNATEIIIQDSSSRAESCSVSEYTSRRRAFLNITDHKQPPISQIRTYGCSAEFGGRIYVEGVKPMGNAGAKYEAHGGKVEYLE